MRLIILCKAPVAGRVKTRLMPEYSAIQAAEIHEKMIDTVLNKANQASFDDIWLAVDDIKHAYFQEMKLKHHLNLCFQGAGDLGDRLNHLMHKSFDQDSKAIAFIGSDSPHVSIKRYQDTMSLSQDVDVIIGPVEDGGYDLIALSQRQVGIFNKINWGSSHVFHETMSNIRKLNLSTKALDTSFDLDRPEDIKRAPPESW